MDASADSSDTGTATTSEPTKTLTETITEGPKIVTELTTQSTTNGAEATTNPTTDEAKVVSTSIKDGTETNAKIKTSKTSWSSKLGKLFKSRKRDVHVAGPPLPPTTADINHSLEESLQPGAIAAATAVSIAGNGTLDNCSSKGKEDTARPHCGPAWCKTTIKQPIPNTVNSDTGSQMKEGIISLVAESSIQTSSPDEHNINGLRSGGGRFTHCFPTTYNNKSSVRDPNLSNAHTLFFSSEQRSTVNAGARGTVSNSRKGCFPISPKTWKEGPGGIKANKRGDAVLGADARLIDPVVGKGVDNSHDRVSRSGCFPHIGKKRDPLSGFGEPKADLTYLDLDEEGNYGSMFSSGVYLPKELTYLEFEKHGRYEPSVQDSSVTYLDLDEQGKYESSVELKKENPFLRTSANTIHSGKEGYQKLRLNRVANLRTSITSFESDEEGMDPFLTPTQTTSYSSFPSADPLPVTRQPVLEVVADNNNLNFHLNSEEQEEDSSNDAEQGTSRGVLETQYEEKGDYNPRRGCLPKRVKNGAGSMKADTLKEAFATLGADGEKVDPSHTDVEPSGPPPLESVGKAQQNDTHRRKFRNGCLGHRFRNDYRKRDLTSFGSEDSSHGEYSADVELSDPWKGEEVAASELKDFRRYKSKPRCLPLSHKPKKCKNETIMSSFRSDENSDIDDNVGIQPNDPEMNEEIGEISWDQVSGHGPKKGCLPHRRMPKKGALEKSKPSVRSDEKGEVDSKAELQLNFTESKEEVGETPWDNLNGHNPRKGCLPFRRIPKKDYPETSRTLVRSDENSDIDDKADVALNSSEMKEEAGETPWDQVSDHKPKKGCLPFKRALKKDYPKTVSIPTESDEDSDNSIKFEQMGPKLGEEVSTVQLEGVNGHDLSNCTESDEDIDYGAHTGPGDCHTGEELAAAQYESLSDHKPRKRCILFGGKRKTDRVESILNPSDSDETRDLLANDSDEIRDLMANVQVNRTQRAVELPQTHKDDLSGRKPKKGCLPFVRKPKKDYYESKLTGVETVSDQLNDPQIGDGEAVDMEWEDVDGCKPKNKSLLFGRQSKGCPGAELTSVEADQNINGVSSADIVSSDLHLGEDELQWKELNDSKQAVGWFPCACLSKKEAHLSSFKTDDIAPNQDGENALNQVRVDVEVSGTEVRGCLPFDRKSKKGKTLYVQSGDNSAQSIRFDFDLYHPLMEGVNESSGEEESEKRLRKRCLPFCLNSRGEWPKETSRGTEYGEPGTLGPESYHGPPKNKVACVGGIFTAKKQKPNYGQLLPVNNLESNQISELAAPMLDKAVDETSKSSCGGFSSNHNSLARCRKANKLDTQLVSMQEFSSTTEVVDRALDEKLEVNESGWTYCGRFARKLKDRTGSALGNAEPELGRTGCGRFAMKRNPRKLVSALQLDGNSGEYPACKVKEPAKENMPTTSEGPEAHNVEGTDGSEHVPLLINGARSRKGFIKKCFWCIDVGDNSSAGSKCSVEAAVIKESIKHDANNAQSLYPEVLEDYHCCSNEGNVVTPNISNIFDPSIDSNTQTAVHTYGPTLEVDMSHELTEPMLQSKGGCTHLRNELCTGCLFGRQNFRALPEVGCGISQLRPFQRHSVCTGESRELSAASQIDPRTQQTLQDNMQHGKPLTQRCSRERWTFCKDKDPKPGMLEDFLSEMQPDPSGSEAISRSTEHDLYRRFPLGKEDPAPHSCDTFRPYKGAELSILETDLTNKKKVDHGRVHSYKRTDSAGLAVEGSVDKYAGDSWLQSHGEGSVPYLSTGSAGRRPENKWLRREGMEPLVELSKASTEEFQDAWLRHDEGNSVAQESIQLVQRPNWPKCWRKWSSDESCPMSNARDPDQGLQQLQGNKPGIQSLKAFQGGLYGDSQGNEYDKRTDNNGAITSQTHAQLGFSASNMDSTTFGRREEQFGKDSVSFANHERLQKHFQEESVPQQVETYENGGFSSPQRPVLEYDTEGLECFYPWDKREASPSGVASNTYDYREMGPNPVQLKHKSESKPMELPKEDQTQGDSSHQCLGRNWQKQQKKESVAQALEASESLLKKLVPIKLPEFESSGHEESSISGLSLNKEGCCLMKIFSTKEKRKSKSTQTKDFGGGAVTVEQEENNQQANDELADTKGNQSRMILEPIKLQDAVLQESRSRRVRRTKGARRIRHSSPVFGFEDHHIGPSTSFFEGESSVHKKAKREDCNEGASKKTYSQFENTRKNEQEVQGSRVVKKAAGASLTIYSKDSLYELGSMSVHATQQELPAKDLAASIELKPNENYLDHQKFKDAIQSKSPPTQRMKLDPGTEKEVVQNRGVCNSKIFTCLSSGDEDSKGEKHQAQSVSVPSITGGIEAQGRKLNTQKRTPYVEKSTSPTEDSSSGEDWYDAASRKFRDELFKTKPRGRHVVTRSGPSSKVLVFNNGGHEGYQTRAVTSQRQLPKDPRTFGPLLNKFENSDQFRGSPVFKELVKVESQMREIAKIISGLAGPDYLESGRDSDDASMDNNSGDFRTEDTTEKTQVSLYKNPLWFAEWAEPVSVQMATRLAGDEVPVYYEDGFKVGYVPTATRGSRGMRKSKPIRLLDKEYNKFTNAKVKVLGSDDDSMPTRHSRKRFSEKYTARGLLHEKTHPHDHRSSGIKAGPAVVNSDYSSSSSSWSWKEDLIESHRRVFSRDTEIISLCKKKKAFDSESSDCFDGYNSPQAENKDVFMSRVDDELARLKIAKLQLGELSSGPLAGAKIPYEWKGGSVRVAPESEDDRVSYFTETRPMTSIKGKATLDSAEFRGEDSPKGSLSLGWIGKCISPPKSRHESPSKMQKAVEKKEFQLLERRVKKELQEKRKSMTIATPGRDTKAFLYPLN